MNEDTNANLYAVLAGEVRRMGFLDRLAHVTDTDRFTYVATYEGARRASAVFAAHGVRSGDTVLLILPDGIDLVWTFLGAIRMGAVPIIANYEQHVDELDHAAEISRPTAIVSIRELPPRDGVPVFPLEELRTAGPPVPPVAWRTAAEPAYGQLTSGTTGEPKLCLHAHGDPLAYHAAFAEPFLRLGETDLAYCVSRMYFSFGLANSLFYPHLSGSASLLTRDRPGPEEAITSLVEHGVGVFYAQPSFYARLLAASRPEVLARTRLAVVSGEPLPGPLEAAVREIVGDDLLNLLGATEVGCPFVVMPEGESRPGMIGRALPPFRIRVVAEDGTRLPPGEEGRLEVRGPTVTPGMTRFGQPWRHGDGFWWRSGDIGVIDADGYCFVPGRADDIEVIGGVNVHPKEVEDFLSKDPRVLEAAVCAVRSGTAPTRLRALVVPAGEVDRARLAVDLSSAAAEHLTWYKRPEDIVFVAELPRTATGKLNRRRLRQDAVAVA
ncbi:MAG TPA: AMP-binding protein [Kribbellaceae bacterium]|nr:AMP-binding protein [Kribbellaceae bacterium]